MAVSGVAKTTIWHHIHDMVLPVNMKRAINSNQGGSRKRKEAALQKAREEIEELMRSKHREISVIVGMLYWAEGSKRDLVFTNTDVAMIRVYLYFLRNILRISESDLHLLIRISDPIKPKDAIQFWASSTNTNVSQVRINHDNIQNKTKSIHGICRVCLKRNSYYLKQIQCIIEVVKQEYAPIV